MKFCTGRNCPTQYDPERGFDFSKCEALEVCQYATIADYPYKTDCYYYLEEQHMNAHIPYCNANDQYDPRNCNEQCPNYITYEQVNQLVKEHLATRKEIEDIKNG